MSMLTIPEAKTHLNITTSVDDAEIALMIDAAGSVVTAYCGYTESTDVTETVMASLDGDRYLTLTHTPVLAVTSITPQIVAVPDPGTDNLIVNQVAGLLYQSTGRVWFGPQVVVYTAGRTGDVPQILKEACKEILADLWKSQRGPALSRPSPQGDDDYVQVPGGAIPRRAAELMDMSPYALGPSV